MSASTAAAQREGTRSFAIEMEEAAALPLVEEEAPSSSAAVPHTPMRDLHKSDSSNVRKTGGAAPMAVASRGSKTSTSVGSSFASPGVSATATDPYLSQPPSQQQQQQPSQSKQSAQAAALPSQEHGGCPVNHLGSAPFSRHTTTAGSARESVALQLLTCRANTPVGQRKAEVEASRDPAFHPLIICPLQNLGNTCYFNSGVQLLANCPALVYGLRNSPFFQVVRTTSPLQSPKVQANTSGAATQLCRRGGYATHALFEEFADLLARMENNELRSGESLSPVRTLDALARVNTQFEGRSQQDAAEMMTAVLSSLEDEGGQFVEVEQVLSSFAEDALAWGQGSGDASSSHSNQNNNNGRGGGASPRPMPGDNSATGTANRSEPYFSDEYSPASPLTSVKTAGTLPGARSAHAMAMLRFMKQVNVENEQLERRVKQRMGVPYLGTFHPPRLHYNPVMDGFRGYAVSQVECHHCHSVSRVVSDYNALLIDVPTSRQRSCFAARHPNLRRLAPDGQPLQKKRHAGFTWWNPLSFFTSAWEHLSRLFTSGVPFPLTLQECLDIHFEPVRLQGSNKYHCESCGTISEATKSETLLGLPEYLVLHMKRFEAGRCFNSKKTDPVIFPVSWTSLTPAEAAKTKLRGKTPEILDLRRYLHSVAAPFAEPIPPCLRDSLNGGTTAVAAATEEGPTPSLPRQSSSASPAGHSRNRNDNKGNCPSTPTPPTPPLPALAASPDGATPWAIPTTYTLDGVVNHHGGYDGGHYTVYLYKTTTEQRVWVYISDDEVVKVTAGDAADSEEYVLLYRRQPMVQPPAETNEGTQLRQKACYYLSRQADAGTRSTSAPPAAMTSSLGGEGEAATATATDSSTTTTTVASAMVYISRMWLQRVAFLCEPGPIVNRLCYCTPEDQAKVTTHHTLFPATVRVPDDVPHVHGPPVEWFYVPITREDYAIFYDAFGGNAPVTAEEVAAIKQMQQRFVVAISAAERAKPRSTVAGSRFPDQR
ncbi:ubiqitin hydrolase [Lotmaria passim]